MKIKPNWKKAWWQRRAAYAVLALLGVVVTGFGLFTAEQVDTFTQQITPIMTLILSGTAGFAATRTNRGSDDPVTYQDLIDVQAQAEPPETVNGDAAIVPVVIEYGPTAESEPILAPEPSLEDAQGDEYIPLSYLPRG